ncbi:hypothetical protein BAE44_0012167, partial [Dichanthelium oligosanthes]
LACIVASQFDEFLKIAMKKQKPPLERTKNWTRLTKDKLKINSDRAYNDNTEDGGWVFMIRDSGGEVIHAGAARGPHLMDAFHAEVLACLAGIKAARDKSTVNVAVEVDSGPVRDATEGRSFSLAPTRGLISEFKSLISTSFMYFSIKYCPRVCNKAVHALTSRSCKTESSRPCIYTLLVELSKILLLLAKPKANQKDRLPSRFYRGSSFSLIQFSQHLHTCFHRLWDRHFRENYPLPLVTLVPIRSFSFDSPARCPVTVLTHRPPRRCSPGRLPAPVPAPRRSAPPRPHARRPAAHAAAPSDARVPSSQPLRPRRPWSPLPAYAWGSYAAGRPWPLRPRAATVASAYRLRGCRRGRSASAPEHFCNTSGVTVRAFNLIACIMLDLNV